MRRIWKATGAAILAAGLLATSACNGGNGSQAELAKKNAVAAAKAEAEKIPVGDAARRLYFEQACRDGRAGLCGELGQMWERGWGGPKDKKKADEYYKLACDRAVVDSCTAIGITLTPEKELEILDKNCAAGNAFSCNNQGQLLFNGFESVKPDRAKAMPLLEKACAGAFGASCRTLAKIYGIGVGVPADEAKAKEYNAKAEAADAAMRALEEKYLGATPHDRLPIGHVSEFTLALERTSDAQDERSRKAAAEKAARAAKAAATPPQGGAAPKKP
jgi:TPR repeat protein